MMVSIYQIILLQKNKNYNLEIQMHLEEERTVFLEQAKFQLNPQK